MAVLHRFNCTLLKGDIEYFIGCLHYKKSLPSCQSSGARPLDKNDVDM